MDHLTHIELVFENLLFYKLEYLLNWFSKVQTSRPSPMSSSSISQSFYGNGNANNSRQNSTSGPTVRPSSVSGPTVRPSQPGMPLGRVSFVQRVLSGSLLFCGTNLTPSLSSVTTNVL